MPRTGLLGKRRWAAWLAFLGLAAYTPVLAWLTRDDSYLFPLAVAAMVGYAIIVDDYLRRRPATEPPDTQTSTRDRPVDSPGSSDSTDQRFDR